MAEPEEDLKEIQASQRGDHEAFGLIVKRHQKMIHALTYRMTGSHADAEDLAQEIFICAHANLASFRGESRFSSWLYRLGINQCLNWQKKSRRRTEAIADWRRENISACPENGIISTAVTNALLRLPPKQRAAIVLTAYDGLSHAEAAETLGCSETTVSWRLFAARVKLKRLLANFKKGDPNEP